MADLRASVGTNSVPIQSTLDLQQKLDKALSDSSVLRAQVSKMEADMGEMKNKTSNDTLRMTTIERQLNEAVAARDSNQQIIKQKCEEIEKLKIILRSTVKEDGEETEKKVDEEQTEQKEDESTEAKIEELNQELQRTAEDLLDISEKYLFSFCGLFLFFLIFICFLRFTSVTYQHIRQIN